jgi:integrase
VLFALYQSRIDKELRSPERPAWWTLRRPARPLNYEAARAMMRRLNVGLGTKWTLHDFRHTAAVRMASDPRVTIADIQRILGHASLATTQEYLRTYDADVFERVKDHLARRSTPPPPAAQNGISYRVADINELAGDSGW